ncbi:uncharacterized protein PV09_05233 [Verruconis gallopava]|uniref:FAD-binding domain-containing protein n=1 Tax=Verruconis gallopava TaxID=253628 RepID=A0A0D2AWD9_9PEZI|nr:uncharacterized protein PV09_05233 [Verruconis gallopava]KIW03464.1 hypothetical protein PV09_05233 [Verruconis gallopava]
MSNMKVLVVGASIAGPATAYWLAKAGVKVTVIERFPNVRTNGQSVDIRAAGVTVMRKIPGMEAAVRAKATQQEGIHFVRDDGKPYATMYKTGDVNQQSLTSEFEIFRGDLAQILFEMSKDDENIEYIFGEQVTSMHQATNGLMKVEFANGLAPTEFDLVIACDGANSRTRALGLKCGVRDHVESVNCWAAYFSINQDLLGGSKMAQLWSTTKGRLVAIGPDSTDVNRIGLLRIHPRDGSDATMAFRVAMKQGDFEAKRHVAQEFAGAGWKTGQLIEAMMEAKDFYASEIVQVKIPTLYAERFVLVGDAGYCPSPFTGAGTTLALVGAYVLAGEISQNKGDLTAALRAYEERMRPIVNDLQKIAPGVPMLFAPQTTKGIYLRNLLFAFIAWCKPFLGWFGKVFGGSLGTDRYKLPNYEWRT